MFSIRILQYTYRNFLTRQQQDENVRHFLSRLKGIASHCDFNTKCSCGLRVSYTENITLFKLVSGLVDEEIKEDILSRGEKSLDDTVKSIEAKESAKRAKSSLIHTPTHAQVSKVGENAVSEDQKIRGCSHCGKKPMVVRTRKENQNVQLLTKSVKNVTELVTFRANACLNLVDR